MKLSSKTTITILTLITAAVHLVLLNIFMGKVDPLFTLNGIGFIAFLWAYLNPPTFLLPYHNLVTYGFMGYTAVTILAFFAMNGSGPVGYFTKLVELVLIIMIWQDSRSG